MKYLLSAILACGIAFGASAQNYVNNYNIVNVSYENFLTSGDGEMKEYMPGMNGFGLEYVHGFSLSQSAPLYLEAGLKFGMASGSKTYVGPDYTGTAKMNATRLSIPVSLEYILSVNDEISIMPYAGLDLRYNISWKFKDEYKDQHGTDTYDLSIFGSEWEQDWGKKGARFQFGWHVGVRGECKGWLLGVSYGTDFTKLYDANIEGDKSGISTGSLAVSVGYIF